MDTTPAATALDDAVKIAGSQAAIAAACEVTPQAVHQWLRKGKTPVEQVLKIEAATGVSRHKLRPDIYGEAPDGAPS